MTGQLATLEGTHQTAHQADAGGGGGGPIQPCTEAHLLTFPKPTGLWASYVLSDPQGLEGPSHPTPITDSELVQTAIDFSGNGRHLITGALTQNPPWYNEVTCCVEWNNSFCDIYLPGVHDLSLTSGYVLHFVLRTVGSSDVFMGAGSPAADLINHYRFRMTSGPNVQLRHQIGQTAASFGNICPISDLNWTVMTLQWFSTGVAYGIDNAGVATADQALVSPTHTTPNADWAFGWLRSSGVIPNIAAVNRSQFDCRHISIWTGNLARADVLENHNYLRTAFST